MYEQTEIIFIRHGETDFNKRKLFFGHLDPELNEKGREQLKKTKALLEKQKTKIDIVFSSDLKRCRQSLEILEIDKNIEKNFELDLRELNFGIFEGKTYEEIKSEFPEKVVEMQENWKKFKVEKSESLEELLSRVIKKLKEIIKKYRGKKILIVSHAGVIQTIISYYLVGNIDLYWKIAINNGAITKMCVNEDDFIILYICLLFSDILHFL